MHLFFKKGNTFHRSPFQYGTMPRLEGRIITYQEKMEEVSETLVSRVDGNNNILIRILQSIDVEFTGDMVEFMGQVHRDGIDLSRTIGMTSNYGVGEIFHGTMYHGCDEIFIANRNEEYIWTDLWYGWRDVSAVRVIDHPITDMTYFMPGVTNPAKISGGESDRLCIFFVDIALLYVQWSLYRGSRKDPTMEHFITEIVMPNMMKSHMDLVIFNRLLMRLGIIEPCEVSSNLPFRQTRTDYEVDRILDIVERNLSGRRLKEELFLSAVPAIYADNILDSISDPSLMPTQQAMWATLASKMKRVAYILELGKRQNWADMTDTVARLKRTIIRNESEKRFGVVKDNGLIQTRFDRYVTERLP